MNIQKCIKAAQSSGANRCFPIPRTFLGLLALVSVACVTRPVTSEPVREEAPMDKPDGPDPVKSSRALAALMKARQFEALKVERMATSHLLLHVSINGSTPRRFVCDTGSGATVVFPELATELGLTAEDSPETAGGIGGAGLDLQTVEIESLQIDGIAFSDRELMVLDLSYINDQFEAAGEKPVAGIIGSPWLLEHEAVIDIPADVIFVRP